MPQDYWAQKARPGLNPARGHTFYEQVEHDQPGTPCRVHSWAHKQDKAKMIEDIRKAKEQADIVVVSMHWGIHFTQAEIAEYQTEYAYDAIDAGADLIFGHHAHILKPIEIYKGKVIFYSLGNFAMSDPNRIERDKKTLRQDMHSSKKHMEMAKIRKGFGTGSAAKTFPEDFKPYAVKRDDPLFKTIYDYMIMINNMMDIETRYTINADEVIIG